MAGCFGKGVIMIIKKVLNNNAAITYNEKGEEVVVVGKGITYNKSQGEKIDPTKVIKRFILPSEALSGEFGQVIQNMPLQHVMLAERIICDLKESGFALGDGIYVTLTDHIGFSLERYKKNMMYRNPFLLEIKKLYPNEFAAGKRALEMIKKETGVDFSEDEAASIAMHIYDAQMHTSNMAAMQVIDIINALLRIIRYSFNMDFDENSLHYLRLVTHIKFFAQRVVMHEYTLHLPELTGLEGLVQSYTKAYFCVKTIQKYIETAYNYEMQESDLVFLTIHIENIRRVQQKQNCG